MLFLQLWYGPYLNLLGLDAAEDGAVPDVLLLAS
jgi:hypothetical protein